MNPATTNFIDELCAEAERSWIDRRDFSVVDRLATEHPEHAEELYDFFSTLVYSSHETAIPEGPAREAARRTRAWLVEKGFDRAVEVVRQTPGPWTFIRFLQERSQARPEEIVRRIGDVSWEFLVMVSRFPALVPKAVASELVSRVAMAWEISPAECLARFEASGPVPVAASRKHPYPPEPGTFAELLERSSLDEDERSYWLRHAA